MLLFFWYQIKLNFNKFYYWVIYHKIIPTNSIISFNFINKMLKFFFQMNHCLWMVFTDNLSVHSNESRNTISPSFQLNIEHLLAEFTDTDREEESSQVRSAWQTDKRTDRRTQHTPAKSIPYMYSQKCNGKCLKLIA